MVCLGSISKILYLSKSAHIGSRHEVKTNELEQKFAFFRNLQKARIQKFKSRPPPLSLKFVFFREISTYAKTAISSLAHV